MLTIPTLLTWARILMIPMILSVYYVPSTWLSLSQANLLATIFFALGAITDWMDGWIARTFHQTSAFGEFLDPVADKLVVAAALVMLVQLGRLDALIAIIIIGREIAVSALREWMAKMGTSRSVAVSLVGKLKTAAQLIAIPMLLYHQPIAWFDPQKTGTFLMYVAAILTLWSMGYYLRKALPEIKNSDGQ